MTPVDTTDAVRMTRTIGAAPDAVYEAFLDPAQLRRWFGPRGFDVVEVDVDPRPGGSHRTAVTGPDGIRGTFDCEIVELVPGERIVMRWAWVSTGPGSDSSPSPSRVTVTLREQRPGETELTLLHERLGTSTPDDAASVGEGWSEALDKLGGIWTAPVEPARLAGLIGSWESRGSTRASATEPSVEISGTDDYEWVAGGRFVLHRVDVRMGDARVEAVELIGCDEERGTYPTHAFDNGGSHVAYEMRERDGVWTIAGATERSTLTIAPDGRSMSAHWERSEDDGATWVPWMDMRFARAALRR